MNRAKDSYEWERFLRKTYEDGYEVFTRLGSPIIKHKQGEPFKRDTTSFVFFRKKNGRFSIHQQKGMEILANLGLRVERWPEKAQ